MYRARIDKARPVEGRGPAPANRQALAVTSNAQLYGRAPVATHSGSDMTRSCMPDQTSARWVVLRLGGALLLIAASAGAWEVLASQAPGSPLYLGVLPGPIER